MASMSDEPGAESESRSTVGVTSTGVGSPPESSESDPWHICLVTGALRGGGEPLVDRMTLLFLASGLAVILCRFGLSCLAGSDELPFLLGLRAACGVVSSTGSVWVARLCLGAVCAVAPSVATDWASVPWDWEGRGVSTSTGLSVSLACLRRCCLRAATACVTTGVATLAASSLVLPRAVTTAVTTAVSSRVRSFSWKRRGSSALGVGVPVLLLARAGLELVLIGLGPDPCCDGRVERAGNCSESKVLGGQFTLDSVGGVTVLLGGLATFPLPLCPQT